MRRAARSSAAAGAEPLHVDAVRDRVDALWRDARVAELGRDRAADRDERVGAQHGRAQPQPAERGRGERTPTSPMAPQACGFSEDRRPGEGREEEGRGGRRQELLRVHHVHARSHRRHEARGAGHVRDRGERTRDAGRRSDAVHVQASPPWRAPDVPSRAASRRAPQRPSRRARARGRRCGSGSRRPMEGTGSSASRPAPAGSSVPPGPSPLPTPLPAMRAPLLEAWSPCQ